MTCPTQQDCETYQALADAAYVILQGAQAALESSQSDVYEAENAFYELEYQTDMCWYELVNCGQGEAEYIGSAGWTEKDFSRLLDVLPREKAGEVLARMMRLRLFEQSNPPERSVALREKVLAKRKGA